MDTIYSKEEIIAGLQDASLKVINWITEQDNDKFTKAADGKWSTSQQLDHLIKSVQPITAIINKPRFIMRTTFGVSNRETRTYSAVLEKYRAKLKAGGLAPTPFSPNDSSEVNKSNMIDRYSQLSKKLVKSVKGLSENDLDKYVLPHPLLGKLPLREMMFFTILHTHHHLDALKRLYGSSA